MDFRQFRKWNRGKSNSRPRYRKSEALTITPPYHSTLYDLLSKNCSTNDRNKNRTYEIQENKIKIQSKLAKNRVASFENNHEHTDLFIVLTQEYSATTIAKHYE